MLLKRKKDLDITNGPLFKTILLFALPIILSNVVTTLFNAADMAVLSAFTRGGNEVASVGATSSVISLFTQFAVGLCAGVNIILARLCGQGDEKNARRVISTAILTAAGMGLLLAVLGSVLGRTVLAAMNCPEECLADGSLYLIIYFLGSPFLLLNQYALAILRVSGDSKRPLYYMLISGAANVVLNALFCLLMGRKVAAVALATLISQAIGALLALRRLTVMEGICRWSIKDTRFDLGALKKILVYGCPTALTTVLFPITNLQVQSAINSFGPAAIAGNTAAIQYETIVSMAGNAFQTAALTFVGQNLGARRKKRVYRSFFYCLFSGLAVTATLAVSIYTFREPLLSVFVAGNEAAIVQGAVRMKYIMLFYILTVNPLASTIQAFGHPTLQTVINVGTVLGLRTFWMQVIYPLNPTLDTLYFCYPLTYIVNFLSYVPIVAVLFLQLKKDKYAYKI